MRLRKHDIGGGRKQIKLVFFCKQVLILDNASKPNGNLVKAQIVRPIL